MNSSKTRQKDIRHVEVGQRVPFVIACVIAVGLSAAGQDVAKAATDRDITRAVERSLLVEESVSSHLIDVTTIDGVVTLSGSVSHLLEKDRALSAAARIKGVRSIIDRLNVRPVEKSDDEIRRDVNKALAFDPATDSYEIDVAVDDGIVTLTGAVESWAEKLLAADVAKGVAGVEDIHNRVTYSYESDRSDFDVEADIEGRLESDPYVDETMIDVTVSDGVAMLTGTVGSVAEKSYVLNDARVAGLKRIIDENLDVREWTRDELEREYKVALVEDDDIKKAIDDAMVYDPRVSSFKIGVAVEEGRVTLTGTVDNLKAKRAAGLDAKNTVGVVSIDNRIKVRPGQDTVDTQIAENLRDAIGLDPILDRFEIAVIVRNHEAFLAGVVDSHFEKEHAEDVAARINGVASIENNLVVRDRWQWKSDAEIKQDIESEYMWSPFVDGGDLAIRVDDGHVELAGRVDSWHEYLESVENAFEGGAKSVRSYLRVEANDRLYDRFWSEPPEEVWPL